MFKKQKTDLNPISTENVTILQGGNFKWIHHVISLEKNIFRKKNISMKVNPLNLTVSGVSSDKHKDCTKLYEFATNSKK